MHCGRFFSSSVCWFKCYLICLCCLYLTRFSFVLPQNLTVCRSFFTGNPLQQNPVGVFEIWKIIQFGRSRIFALAANFSVSRHHYDRESDKSRMIWTLPISYHASDYRVLDGSQARGGHDPPRRLPESATEVHRARMGEQLN